MLTDPSPVLDLSAPAALDLAEAGGKGAGLARLVAAGLPVPPGFVVSAAAYRAFAADLDVVSIYRQAGGGSTGAVMAREAMQRHPVPGAIADAIRTAYLGLDSGYAGVAVRSSATAEDLPEASFAGQQDTFLNVRGPEDVLAKVRQCWASLWTDRAVDYRERHAFEHESVQVAVVVQEMVEPDAAGVLFTANPVSGRREEAVVNAAYGLGEAVVSGFVTPDTIVVDKASGAIRAQTTGRKDKRIVSAGEDGTEVLAVADDLANAPALSDEQVRALVEMGGRVESLHGRPQDIEWAFRAGQIYLLQSRPITAIAPLADLHPDDQWVRGLFTEVLPDAPSPAFCSVMVPILTRMMDFTFRQLGHSPPADITAIRLFYSQPYVNLRYVRAALIGLPPSSRERMARRMANPFDEHQRAGAGRPSLADLVMAGRLVGVIRALPKRLPVVIDEYYAGLARARSLDVARAPDAELADEVVRVAMVVVPPLVEWDFLLIAGMGFAERLVDGLVARSGVNDGEAVRGALMSGISGNLTMETNKALWRLAQVARAAPAVRAELESGEADSALGRARAVGDLRFNGELDAFLDRFGHREGRMDIAVPTWGEDTTPVAAFVRAYLRHDDGTDPGLQETAMLERRAAAAGAVEAGLDPVRRRLFRWSLARSEELARDRDTMHFHWTACFPVLRSLMGELGTRWEKAGLIPQAADVYCLGLDELPELARSHRPMDETVRARREAWERDQVRVWPTEIRLGTEVYGHELDSARATDGDALSGIPGSPGLVTGPACVVRGPDDFARLVPGAILVAPLTTPVWTPLFAVAGGLVTETGGILSHGAIVAREYGIPAVMGVRGAMTRIADGAEVTVDGSRGTVTGAAVSAQVDARAADQPSSHQTLPDPPGLDTTGSL